MALPMGNPPCNMDAQQIKAFIDAMAASDLDEMEISHDGWTLRLVRRAGASPVVPSLSTVAASGGAAQPASSPAIAASAPAGATEVLAPLFGVVHLQQAPGEPPFVTPGQVVEAGHLLCVIEAMKVFNDVRAEHDGTIAEVLVSSGQEVEAGQPLLRLAWSA
jgi:acetyl-CoA carboxylase biotin carboxyl carrier protein